ncbi:hypothetical protein OpiT1DRAFT_02139 [Opitutaceae bacterium TAV1]|nr:hypothetical protein OpiT1DRAFT_02139 [Opitutaceae bacterium TAV1]
MTFPDEPSPAPHPASAEPSRQPPSSSASAADPASAILAEADLPHQPHDKLFKTNFRDIPTAVAFFQNYLPARIVKKLDFSRIKVVPGSHVTGKLKSFESDLLFRVALKGKKDKEALVYLLFEHQYEEDRWIALRLLRYQVSIWETWLKEHPKATRLPVIVPVVLAHNKTPWTLRPRFDSLLFNLPGPDNANAPTRAAAIAGADAAGGGTAMAGNTDAADAIDDLSDFIPAFTFGLLQLAQIPFDKIMGTPLGILTLRIFKAQRLGGNYPDSPWIWDETLFTDLAPLALEQIFTYMSGRPEFDIVDIQSKVAYFESETVKHTAMTIAQRLRQEGREEGRVEGIERGELLGRIQVLQEILGKKVTPRKNLIGKPLAELNALLERLRSEHRSR